MQYESLTPVEIEGRLAELPRWNVDDRGKLTRQFQFVDFVAAFGFLAQAAVHAERLNHHPEWFNVYGRVDVALTTHDAGGLTSLDFELASVMEDLASGLPQKAL